MARGLNKIQIIGNLGRDPETKRMAGGKVTTLLSVGVGRNRRSQDGQTSQETDWFRVICWEKLAETADQYLKKGQRVYVEGRLQMRKYTGRDGQERTLSEVIANDLILLSPREEKAAQGAGVKSDKAWTPEREFFGDDDDLPF